MNEEWNLISANEAAKLLSIKPGTISTWIFHKKLPFPVYKIGTRTLRFKRTDIIAYLEKIKNEQA